MNFNKHHKDIKKLLLRPEKRKSSNPNKPHQEQFYKGIYVISRDKELDKNNRLQYKVGMAHGSGGIYKRMDGYKMGFPYPDEFWFHFCIITPKPEGAKKLENIILSYKNMEKVKNPRNDQQNLEYMYRVVIQKITMQDALLKALKDNPKLWDYAVTFGKEGWKILSNTGADLIGSGALSKPRDDYRKQPMLYSKDKDRVETERLKLHRNTGPIYDLTRNQDFDIYTIKKGDRIRDKYSKDALVVKVSKKGETNKRTPYIEVKSEEYPEKYKLYILE